MKQIKSFIKQTNRNLESLKKKEQNVVIGGGCGCACAYSNCGGSSTTDNKNANTADNLGSLLPAGTEWNGLL